jgi:hypothetical protein
MIWVRHNLDKLLLTTFCVVFVLLGLWRFDHAGDGLRHLDHILRSRYPALGEPRWLLFPTVLFLVVKPFVSIGAIHTVLQATKVFCFFNALCGFFYLVCLRHWLRGLSVGQRTAVLLLAGGSSVFLTLATDTIEPTPAVLVAVSGLTVARFRRGLSDDLRVTVAVASLMLAGLVYQGLLFGVFLLPCIFPYALLTCRRIIFRVVLLVSVVPLVTTVLLCFGGDAPSNALRRFVQGESNVASARQYSVRSAKNIAGVAIVGPAYAFASIPDLRGVTGSIQLLRHRKSILGGIRGVVAWFCMAFAIIWAIIVLVVRRQLAVLVAFAGMMVLPALRMSQYSYLKYYVLLPLIIVLAVPRLGVRFVYLGVLGALVLLSNIDQMWARRVEGEKLRLHATRAFAGRISNEACFLTSGWGVPIPHWRGSSLAWAHILNGGNSASQAHLSKENSQLLRTRLKDIFCKCPQIVTDSFFESNLVALQHELSYFQIVDIPLATLVVPATNSVEIFRSAKFGVYLYSPENQRRACEVLQ